MIPNVLSIAGSDPSGGAGIQADLKAFSANRAFGTTVVTALTAQSTTGVTDVHPVPASFIAAQLDTLLADVRIDAVKIGMVAARDVADTIRTAIDRHRLAPVVLDPVMVAKGGDRLVDDAGIAAVRERLLPVAEVVTPNLHEAAAILGRESPAQPEGLADLAREIHALGPRYVLVKGGALTGSRSVDVLYDGNGLEWLSAPRVKTANTHGTGCTLSSAIAALLPRSPDTPSAIRTAKAYVGRAIAASGSLEVGGGHGPVHHFEQWY